MAKQKFICLLAMLLSLCAVATAHAAEQQLISGQDAFYPRLLELRYQPLGANNGELIASATSFSGGRGHAEIFISSDQGQSFQSLSRIDDDDFAFGLCCGGLYELPQAVGALAAGTLLWAGSVGQENAAVPMQLKIFSSADQGRHWDYLSNCATADKPKSEGGLWEAEFALAADGRLLCFYSDETQAGHSQVLRYTASANGVDWSAPLDVVASAVEADRPGMANVVRLADGSYVMSYEVCGPPMCAVYIRGSSDALDWGDPQQLGTQVMTDSGLGFWGTPTLVWAPKAGSAKGQLLLQGQRLVRNGTVQAGNGASLFINASGDLSGSWQVFDSPTATAMPSGIEGNYCQNYSSPLLPLSNGTQLLELASNFDAANVCKTWFRVAPLGGVRASLENPVVRQGESVNTLINVHVSDNFAGDYQITLESGAIPASVSLSVNQIHLDTQGQLELTIEPLPATAASSLASFALPLMVLLLIKYTRAARSRLVLVTIWGLVSCGGGGGTSERPKPSVTIHYPASISLVKADNPAINTRVNFTITLISAGS